MSNCKQKDSFLLNFELLFLSRLAKCQLLDIFKSSLYKLIVDVSRFAPERNRTRVE